MGNLPDAAVGWNIGNLTAQWSSDPVVSVALKTDLSESLRALARSVTTVAFCFCWLVLKTEHQSSILFTLRSASTRDVSPGYGRAPVARYPRSTFRVGLGTGLS